MKLRLPKPARTERGTLIVALMAGIAIMMIFSAVAVQNWGDVVRRDNEAEMMFRAQDIVRALKRFQADKGKLPTELKELMEPGNKNQYFLRKLWKDPLVKGGQWQLVYASPSGGLFDPTVPGANPGANPNGPNSGQQGGMQIPPLGSNPPASDPSAFPPFAGSDKQGATGQGGDPVGFPIAGVKTKCKDRAFRKWKEKTEYADWVFSIFDQDQKQLGQQQPGTQNPNNSAFPPQSPPQIPPPGVNPSQPPPQTPKPDSN